MDKNNNVKSKDDALSNDKDFIEFSKIFEPRLEKIVKCFKKCIDIKESKQSTYSIKRGGSKI